MTLHNIFFYGGLIYIICGILILTYHMICLHILAKKLNLLDKVVSEVNAATDYKLDSDKIKQRISEFGFFEMMWVMLLWPRIVLLFFDLRKKMRK